MKKRQKCLKIAYYRRHFKVYSPIFYQEESCVVTTFKLYLNYIILTGFLLSKNSQIYNYVPRANIFAMGDHLQEARALNLLE